MAKIDFDVPHLCPHCNEPMQVLMPVWITPGNDSIDTGAIEYESSNPQDSSKWWCNTCEESHFPAGLDDDGLDEAVRAVVETQRTNTLDGYQGAGHFDHHQD